ncbi:MAG: hypothetical protein WD851_18470 [Pirellulales bacterium]
MPKHFVTVQLAIALLVLQSPRLALGEPSVGVYYYPWYGSFSGGHSVNQSLRGHLDPPQPPALGTYSNRDAATISAHIDHSHQGNVDFWAVSWWGPNSAENITFRDSILAHPRRAELEYAVHYESTGRLGTFENPTFHNLIPDFRYLANNYFDDPDYLRIDDRPVVFMYVTRAYFNSQASRDAVSNLRSTMIAEFGVDPYIVGDDLFGGGVDVQRAQLWDAITDFDVYGTVLQGGGSTSAALSALAGVYDDAREAIADLDVGFIPGASPGFNDKGVRDGHPAAPRYLVDDPNATEGGLFAKMLNEVVVPRTDPRADHILMINSFNEWHEDTQIEPTVIAERTNIDDSGSQYYSEGYFYEGYGDLYLNILRAATIIPGDYSGNGAVDAADYTIWRDSVGQTGLGRIADGNHDVIVNQLDHGVWFANFGTSTSGSSSSHAIPEPTTLVLLVSAFLYFGYERLRRHFAV